MLAQANGAACCGGAFVLLPSGGDAVFWTMEEVNAGAWKAAYVPEVREAWFFAVDVLGHPFGILGEDIVRLDPETGTLEPVAKRLGEFLDAVRADPDEFGEALLRRWESSGTTLAPRERLVPAIPFMMAGAPPRTRFVAVDLMDALDYHADLHARMKDVPDGTPMVLVDDRPVQAGAGEVPRWMRWADHPKKAGRKARQAGIRRKR